MTTMQWVEVTLPLKKKTPAGWLTKGKSMDATIAQNGGLLPPPAAPAPNPFPLLTAAIQAMDPLQAKAKTGGPDVVAARNLAWSGLRKAIREVKKHVQNLCDAAPDVATAKAIAAAAGFGTRPAPVRKPKGFTGTAIGGGSVELYAPSDKADRGRAFFEWQMRLKGTTDYTSLPTTNNGSTTVHGLTRGQEYEFRWRKTVKNVPTPWSDPKPVVVT